MSQDKEYTWWQDGHFFDTHQIFPTEAETMKSAREEYQRSLPDCEDYFSLDDDTDELCPVVNIGLVQHIDVDEMINEILISIKDRSYEYVSDFGTHCDIDEPEFVTTEESDNALKEAIDKWLHSAHIMPIALAIPMYVYDCKQDKIVKL